jgi:hypothetical protein
MLPSLQCLYLGTTVLGICRSINYGDMLTLNFSGIVLAIELQHDSWAEKITEILQDNNNIFGSNLTFVLSIRHSCAVHNKLNINSHLPAAQNQCTRFPFWNNLFVAFTNNTTITDRNYKHCVKDYRKLHCTQ